MIGNIQYLRNPDDDLGSTRTVDYPIPDLCDILRIVGFLEATPKFHAVYDAYI